ncbi:MAG: DNA polymerase III subunit delta [Alphaproteobacteria bacterium]
MKVAPRDIKRIMDAPLDPKVRVILIYGPDYGLVQERFLTLARKLASHLDDPFQVAQLNDAQLIQEPDRIGEEAAQTSMLGDQRVILVRGAAQGAAKALERFFKHLRGDGVVFLSAGDLRPDHALRKQCESQSSALAIPCYLEDARAIEGLIEREFRSEAVTIDPNARQYLVAHLGSDHGLSRSEITKLAIYAGPGGHLGLEEVQAALGDSAEFQISDSLNPALIGNWGIADRALEELFALGINAIAILRSLSGQLVRLQEIKYYMQQGLSPSEAIQKLTPKPFFKVADQLQAQAQRWQVKDLNRALELCLNAEVECKKTNQPDKLIVSRLLMQLANQARKRA